MTPTQLRMIHQACDRRDARVQLHFLRTINAGVAPTSMIKDGHLPFNQLLELLSKSAGI